MNDTQSPQAKNTFWANTPVQAKVVTLIIISVIIASAVQAIWAYITFTNQSRKETAQVLKLEAIHQATLTEGVMVRSLSNLRALALSPSIIEAVQAVNQQNSSLSDDEIASLDQAWKDEASSIADRVVSIQESPVSDHLRSFLKSFAEEKEVFITDQRGLNVAMSEPTSDYWQADEGWWQSAYAGGTGVDFIDQVEFDDSAGIYAVNMAVPVRDESGFVIGILRGTVDVSIIFQELASAQIGETGQITLIDPEGTILFSKNSDLFMQPAPEGVMEFIASQEAWSTQYPSPTGNSVMLTASGMSGSLADLLGWTFLAEQSLAEINTPIQKMGVTGVLLALGVLAALAFITNFISSRSFTRSLKALTSAAEHLAGGELVWELEAGQARLLQGRKDEIGRLASSLNTTVQYMLDKVFWYENILDSVPFPLSVTDMNMNWTFINRPVENFIKVKRKDVIGHQCSEWNANICKTENCGIARLRKNFLTTMFSQQGGEFKVDSSYLVNRNGERIGHIEAVQDITQMVAGQKYQLVAVEQMAGYLNEMATGNLAFDIHDLPPADASTTEVRQSFLRINQSLEVARDRLNATIHSVIETADQVNEASTALADAANQAGTATGQIATTIQQVAKGTSSQNEAISRMAALVEEVTRTVDGVSRGTSDQAEAVRQATLVSTQISSSDGLSARVNESAHKVQEMGQSSELIGQIVETIEDIASQTNLLALNAAIEAARAGEHGKGFAVVADEVRKLAERASTATKEIGALITRIRSSVSDAVEMSNSAANGLSKAAEGLAGAIQSVSTVVNANATATQKLSSSAGSVMESIESVASVSEENSAAIEEVSASTEEMTAQVEEVTASAQNLAELANRLQSMVNQFKVEQHMSAVAGPAAQSYAVTRHNGHNRH